MYHDISFCDGQRTSFENQVQICPLRHTCLRYLMMKKPHNKFELHSWIVAPFIGDQCDHYYDANVKQNCK